MIMKYLDTVNEASLMYVLPIYLGAYKDALWSCGKI